MQSIQAPSYINRFRYFLVIVFCAASDLSLANEIDSPEHARIVTVTASARHSDEITRLGDTRFRTSGHCVFVSDQEIVDEVLNFWDVRSGRLTRTVSKPDLRGKVTVSPDGKILALSSMSHVHPLGDGSDYCQVTLFDLSSGRELWRFKEHDTVHSVCFTPNSKLLAVARTRASVESESISEVEVFNVSNRAVSNRFSFAPDVKPISIALDERMHLAVGQEENGISIWSVSTGKMEWKSQAARLPVYRIAYSSDSSVIVSGGLTDFRDPNPHGEIAIYDAATKGMRKLVEVPYEVVIGYAVAPKSRGLLAVREQNLVQLDYANLDPGDPILTIEESGRKVDAEYRIEISPNGKTLLTENASGCIGLRDFETGTALFERSGHTDVVRAVAVSSDDRRIATSGKDLRIRIWETASGNELTSWPVQYYTDNIHFIRHGNDVSLAGMDQRGHIRKWNLRTGEETWSHHCGKEFRLHNATRSGRFCVVGGSAMIEVWDCDLEKKVSQIGRQSIGVVRLAIDSAGSQFAGLYADGSLRVWSVDESKELWVNTPEQDDFRISHMTSCSDSLLLLDRGGVLDRRDFATGKQMGHVGLPGTRGARINQLIATENGSHVAVLMGNEFSVYDASTGERMHRLRDDVFTFNQIQFLNGSCGIVSVSDDRAGVIWRFQKSTEER